MSLDTYSLQPAPTPGRSDVTALVVADLERRAEAGALKYGTRLLTHNGRQALIDAYQEALGLACYLRQAIEEMACQGELTRTVPAAIPEGMMTSAEAAAYLGCSIDTLRTWRKANPDALPIAKHGSMALYKQADLDALKAAREARKAARSDRACPECGSMFGAAKKRTIYCSRACADKNRTGRPPKARLTIEEDVDLGDQDERLDLSLLIDSRTCGNCQSGYQYEPGSWACAMRLSLHCKPSLVSRHWQPRHVLGVSA